MFWARSEIAKSLQKFHIEEQTFEVNKNRLDGAIPHAVERLFGVLTIHHGKKLWLY
jgi:lipopolysaccharide biosynthesis protein